MKTRTSPGLFLTVTITAVLSLAAGNVPAQDSTPTSAAQTAPVQMSYGVSQIIQLSKAKVNDNTIVNYIRNSGSSYGMDASQIVYLKQQGVSDTVINTMLNQPRPAAQAAPQPVYPAASSTAPVVQPAVTYVQTAPAYVPSSAVYVIPDTQTYRDYNNIIIRPTVITIRITADGAIRRYHFPLASAAAIAAVITTAVGVAVTTVATAVVAAGIADGELGTLNTKRPTSNLESFFRRSIPRIHPPARTENPDPGRHPHGTSRR